MNNNICCEDCIYNSKLGCQNPNEEKPWECINKNYTSFKPKSITEIDLLNRIEQLECSIKELQQEVNILKEHKCKCNH